MLAGRSKAENEQRSGGSCTDLLSSPDHLPLLPKCPATSCLHQASSPSGFHQCSRPVQLQGDFWYLERVSCQSCLFLRDGIITEEILGHELLSKCFIPNLYEPHHAIEMLLHNFNIAPLSCEPQSKEGTIPPKIPIPSKREKREYLMMSLVPPIPDKDLSKHNPKSSVIAPRVVSFSQDCVPLSCFSNTISCLLSLYNWRLCRMIDGSPECLAHNVVSLYDPLLPVQVVLTDCASHLRIYICAEDTDKHILPKACVGIQKTVFAAIADVFESMQLAEIDVTPAFLCSCDRSSETHSAFAYEFDSKWFLRCSKTCKSIGAAQPHHTMWLATNTTEKKTPTLPKLLQLQVHKKVGANYRMFGIILLDEDGSQIDALEVECFMKPNSITLKILQQWILGRGLPVEWKILIQTLKDCELSDLADQIQKSL